MRVFHVIEARAGMSDPARAALAADAAAQAGDEVVWHEVTSRAPLRRKLALQRAWRDAGQVDRVHAWSMTTGVAMVRTMDDVTMPVTVTVTRRVLPDDRDAACLASWADRQNMRIEAISGAVADDLALAGVDAGKIEVIEPAMDLGRLERVDRRAVRQRWGVDDDVRVVGLVGDPWLACDAMLGVWIVGLAAATGRPLAMAAHPSMRGVARAHRMLARVGWEKQLIVDGQAGFWDTLRGCDAVLAAEHAANYGGADYRMDMPRAAGLAGGLGLRWAVAAGLAVVAERAPANEALLGGYERARLYAPGSASEAARGVCEAASA